MNVLYECDSMDVCTKHENKQKEKWHPFSKPLNVENP
jgi:hypothetical protein